MLDQHLLGRGALSLALSLALAACASHSRRPESATTGASGAEDNTGSSTKKGAHGLGDTDSPTAGSIHIDPRIVQACGNMPNPHFPFDSAAIRDQAADRLQLVAKCFVSGPLQGRTVKLVGRADPRGGDMYNLTLGQDRASSVAKFLESMGVQPKNISTTSRGSMDATGTDEEGWARDRRVDILLAD